MLVRTVTQCQANLQSRQLEIPVTRNLNDFFFTSVLNMSVRKRHVALVVCAAVAMLAMHLMHVEEEENYNLNVVHDELLSSDPSAPVTVSAPLTQPLSNIIS